MADEDEDVIEEEAPSALAGDESETAAVSPVVEKPLDPPKYEVRPGLGEKFQAENIREIILSTMQEQLMGRQYRADQAPRWAKAISNTVRQRAMELNMKRYKIIAQCTIIEMKGAGVKCAQRTIWDPETDDFTFDMYRNDTIFCHTTCYGVYMY